LHPADIAEILEIVDLPQAQYLYQLLDEELASEVLVEIEILENNFSNPFLQNKLPSP
jgi:Mg/Co/Ni transporter MgtE